MISKLLCVATSLFTVQRIACKYEAGLGSGYSHNYSHNLHILEQNALYNPPSPYGGRKNHYVFLIPYTLHYNLRHCKSTCHLSTPTCMALKTPVQNGIKTVMCIDQKLTVGIPSPEGDCSRYFSWSTWCGLPKKSGAAFAAPCEIPQIQPPSPKLWVIITNHPII